MRSIPSSLAAKVRDLQQTRANNNEPKLQAILTRHKVPLTDFDMWQRSTIPDINPSRTSIAVRRPSALQGPDAVYVGAVQDGVGKVFMGSIHGVTPPSTWALQLTLNNAVDIALAFAGTYAKIGSNVEFVTGDLWVFWITAAGSVYGKIMEDAGTGIELATDAVALSALMGPGNIGLLTVSDGIVLAWTATSGAVLTRQYFGGVWESAVLQSSFPENAVDIALSRTWDYRLSVNLKSADGKVWLINGNSQVSGNANNAYIDVPAIDLTVQEYKTIEHDTAEAEHLEVSSMDMAADVYSTIAPTLLSVANIDDGTGNWGVKLRLVYSGPVYDIAGNAAAYVLSGGAGFTGEALAYDPADPDLKTLILTVTDFNNASPSCTLNYTQGTVSTGPGVTLLPNHSMAFTATGLVPNAPPAVLSIVAVNNTTIDVQFDAALSSVNIGANSAAFAVTGNEPAYSPGGANVPTTYVMSTVAFKPGTTDTVRLTLTYPGRLKHPQSNVAVAYVAGSGNLKNAAGTLGVSTFSTVFDPDDAALALFFNPHDAENIQVSLDLTVDVGQIAYVNGKSGDENIQVGNMDLTVSVFDTNSNPV